MFLIWFQMFQNVLDSQIESIHDVVAGLESHDAVWTDTALVVQHVGFSVQTDATDFAQTDMTDPQ